MFLDQVTVISVQVTVGNTGRSSTVNHQPSIISGQGGWLMPVAAFIIVVMGLLAAGMARVGSQTSIAGAQEGVTVQTFYAADAGAQYAMSRLLYDTAADRVAADGACTAFNGTAINLGAAGMQNCTVNVTCAVELFTNDDGATTSFYDIHSAATCGSGGVTAQRSIEVSAFLK